MDDVPGRQQETIMEIINFYAYVYVLMVVMDNNVCCYVLG